MVGKGMCSKSNTIRGAVALTAAAALVGLAAPTALADPPQGHRIPERLVSSERSASVGNLRSLEEASVRPDDARAHAGCERGAGPAAGHRLA